MLTSQVQTTDADGNSFKHGSDEEDPNSVIHAPGSFQSFVSLAQKPRSLRLTIPAQWQGADRKIYPYPIPSVGYHSHLTSGRWLKERAWGPLRGNESDAEVETEWAPVASPNLHSHTPDARCVYDAAGTDKTGSRGRRAREGGKAPLAGSRRYEDNGVICRTVFNQEQTFPKGRTTKRSSTTRLMQLQAVSSGRPRISPH